MQYGHFDNERREYVIDRVDAPFSFTNYLGRGRLGAVVNQHAGGYLARFSRIHQFRAFQGAVLAERERSRARPADASS